LPVKSGKDLAILKLENGTWRIVGKSDSEKKAKSSIRARNTEK